MVQTVFKQWSVSRIYEHLIPKAQIMLFKNDGLNSWK